MKIEKYFDKWDAETPHNDNTTLKDDCISFANDVLYEKIKKLNNKNLEGHSPDYVQGYRKAIKILK